MACDEAILEACASLGNPVLRLYSWSQPAATFGYFQKYAEAERMTTLRPLVRRPTAGGLVPHDGDWTYSLVFPPAHPWYGLRAPASYRLLHQWIQGAFQRLAVATSLAGHTAKTVPGQCFAGPDKFDLLWQNKKIAGAAQRRTRFGLLIQGSIQPPSKLARSFWTESFLETAREKWKTEICLWTMPEPVRERAQELARTKYSQPDYNLRR